MFLVTFGLGCAPQLRASSCGKTSDQRSFLFGPFPQATATNFGPDALLAEVRCFSGGPRRLLRSLSLPELRSLWPASRNASLRPRGFRSCPLVRRRSATLSSGRRSGSSRRTSWPAPGRSGADTRPGPVNPPLPPHLCLREPEGCCCRRGFARCVGEVIVRVLEWTSVSHFTEVAPFSHGCKTTPRPPPTPACRRLKSTGGAQLGAPPSQGSEESSSATSAAPRAGSPAPPAMEVVGMTGEKRDVSEAIDDLRSQVSRTRYELQKLRNKNN